MGLKISTISEIMMLKWTVTSHIQYLISIDAMQDIQNNYCKCLSGLMVTYIVSDITVGAYSSDSIVQLW